MHFLTASHVPANVMAMASQSSPIKTIAMGGVAVVAIILAIVVAVKTFSDPTVVSVKAPTEPISGSWSRKVGGQVAEPPPGAPAEMLIAKNVASFDASGAAAGTVKLTFTDGRTDDCKVLTSQPGHLLVEVQTKAGKPTQLTIAQMGEGGPMIVADNISSVQFEPTK